MRLCSMMPATNGALPSDWPRYMPVPAPTMAVFLITQPHAGHFVEIPTIC
jgi:purine-cytosine permease-like protein